MIMVWEHFKHHMNLPGLGKRGNTSIIKKEKNPPNRMKKTYYYWSQGPSPKFSEEWACDNWHDWKAVENQLKLARGHIKNGKGKGIIYKMLGTCIETPCQHRENDSRGRQGLKEEIEGRKAAK